MRNNFHDKLKYIVGIQCNDKFQKMRCRYKSCGANNYQNFLDKFRYTGIKDYSL